MKKSRRGNGKTTKQPAEVLSAEKNSRITKNFRRCERKQEKTSTGKIPKNSQRRWRRNPTAAGGRSQAWVLADLKGENTKFTAPDKQRIQGNYLQKRACTKTPVGTEENHSSVNKRGEFRKAVSWAQMGKDPERKIKLPLPKG